MKVKTATHVNPNNPAQSVSVAVIFFEDGTAHCSVEARDSSTGKSHATTYNGDIITARSNPSYELGLAQGIAGVVHHACAWLDRKILAYDRRNGTPNTLWAMEWPELCPGVKWTPTPVPDGAEREWARGWFIGWTLTDRAGNTMKEVTF